MVDDFIIQVKEIADNQRTVEDKLQHAYSTEKLALLFVISLLADKQYISFRNTRVVYVTIVSAFSSKTKLE